VASRPPAWARGQHVRDHRVQQHAQPGSIIAGGWPSTRAWSVRTGGASEWAPLAVELSGILRDQRRAQLRWRGVRKQRTSCAGRWFPSGGCHA
jgi:hypothetical protein